MALSSEWKSNEQDNTVLPDWRVVGNRSCRSLREYDTLYSSSLRRGSFSTETDDGAWNLFKGFQWTDESNHKEASNHFDFSSSLHGSLFRQNRSFSFSIGQEPHSFGYHDYPSRSQLSEPVMEKVAEEEDQEIFCLPSQTYMLPKINTSITNSRRSSISFGPSLSEGLQSLDIISGIIPNGVPADFITKEEDQETASPLQSTVCSSPVQLSSTSIILSETSSNSTASSNTKPYVPENTSSTGKGTLLSRLPLHIPLYMVEFKSGRTDFYYLSDPTLSLKLDDLVLVEADRGRDLGKVATQVLTADQVVLLDKRRSVNETSTGQESTFVKKIYRLATISEIHTLTTKAQDEQKALQLCLQKIKHRKLDMEIVDAEFQWDRRKLTFYFIAEKRIDFRELVRELFKIYKTRIWMCSVNQTVKY